MKISIGAKLWAGFLSILLVIVIIGLVCYQSTTTLVGTASAVTHTHKVIGTLTELLSALQDAETGQRGYVITGEASYLAPYRTAVPKIDDILNELKRLTADNPAQQRRLDAIAATAQVKLRELKQVIDLRDTKGFEAARAHILTDRGKNAMDEFRDIAHQMENEEIRLLKHRDAEAIASAQHAFTFITTGIFCACLLVIALALLLTRHVTVPLKQVTDIAERIGYGDLSVSVPPARRSDELGTLMGVFERMLGSLKEMAGVAQKIATGELRVGVVPHSDKDMLGNAFVMMISNLREMNREIGEGVNVIAGSSSEILSGVTQIAAGAAETASAMSETSTTVMEVKQTAIVSSQKAKTVSDAAQRAVQVAHTGRNAVEETTTGIQRIRDQMELIAESITRLSEQTQAIGEIVASVSDLSEQSNLLAVNASIEAAKAGEQGKGFAVVASEVKSMALQSKQATAQVRAILGDIQKATAGVVLTTEHGIKTVEDGVSQARSAGDAIRLLADSIDECAQAASQIAVSSQQQLAGMDQLASATESIKVAVAQNMESAKQSESAVRNLHELGQRLKSMVGLYKV